MERVPSRKSERRQRTKLVQLRVSPAEAADLAARAQAGGFATVADFVRVKTLGGRPLRSRLDIAQLVKVEAAVHRIGVNVNQIAALVNKRSEADSADLAKVLDELEKIYQLIDALHPQR